MRGPAFSTEPSFIANSAGNFLNPPGVSGGVNVPAGLAQINMIVMQITITNTSASSATVSLYKGVTAGSTAGTQIGCALTPVPANSSIVIPGPHMFGPLDFLTALSGTNGVLTLTCGGWMELV